MATTENKPVSRRSAIKASVGSPERFLLGNLLKTNGLVLAGLNLSVCVSAVADSGDGDANLSDLLEEDAIVGVAETESGHGSFELLHIAVARGKVAVDAVEDVESGLAVDGSDVGLRVERPDNGEAGWGRCFAHRPNSRSISS